MTQGQAASYRAFISYSHTDKKWAKWLHNHLESFRIPRYLIGQDSDTGKAPARLTPIFRDQDELASSADLSERINDALHRSENLVVVCSPRAARSQWVNQEILAFKRLGRSERIFCLIVDGDAGAVGSADDCFPPALREKYDRTGTAVAGAAEPIAADVRKNADGSTLALQKMLAGLLDVGLDQLRRREYQRRQRRLLAITGTSVTATMLTALLAWDAVQARNEADSRRQQAEELLGFMVGDFRESLTPIGRLDLLEDVGAQAMDYFATVNVSDLSDEELARQAQVLTQLGEIKVEQNSYEPALAAFIEAYARSSALAANNPAEQQHIFNRGQVEYWLGFVSWRTGAAQEAETWWTQYLASSQQLVAMEPGKEEWLTEVGYAHNNLAVLAEDLGDLAGAQAGYTYYLDVLRDIQSRNDAIPIGIEIANAISFLGNVAHEQGNLAAALDYYRQCADLLQALLARDSQNAFTQERLAVAHYHVASAHAMTGALDAALAAADAAIELQSQLIIRDPSNTNLQRARSSPEAIKVGILIARDELDSAEETLAASINTLESILAAGATDLGIREFLGRAYLLQARLALARQNPNAASSSAALALEHMRVFETPGRRLSTERRAQLTNVYLALAELAQLAGNASEASQYLQSAGAVLENTIDTVQAPELLMARVQYLTLSGRVAEAAPLQESLELQGYVPFL